MEERIEKTIDFLNEKGVNILTKTFITYNEEEVQVGKNHRCSYVNSEVGRQSISEKEPENIVAAVFAIWGDEPTVV